MVTWKVVDGRNEVESGWYMEKRNEKVREAKKWLKRVRER